MAVMPLLMMKASASTVPPIFGNHLIRVKQFNDKKYNLSSAYFFCINLFEIYDYTIVQFKMQGAFEKFKDQWRSPVIPRNDYTYPKMH
jgi:hypothetical protein